MGFLYKAKIFSDFRQCINKYRSKNRIIINPIETNAWSDYSRQKFFVINTLPSTIANNFLDGNITTDEITNVLKNCKDKKLEVIKELEKRLFVHS